MTGISRLSAVMAYIPVIGWLYVFLFQRSNASVLFHLRQSIGLILFVFASLLLWAVVAWVLAWIPLLAVVSAALFALVIATWLFGAVTLVIGVINALNNRLVLLPGFGQWANRLPIR